MSWGNMFDATGGFTFGDDGPAKTDATNAAAGTKRLYGEETTDNSFAKKARGDDDYGESGYEESGEQGGAEISWDNMGSLTSWDQLAAPKPKPKPKPARGRGRGGSRGGGGGGGGWGQSSGGDDYGGYGGANQFGDQSSSGGGYGGSSQFGNSSGYSSNDNWGDGGGGNWNNNQFGGGGQKKGGYGGGGGGGYGGRSGGGGGYGGGGGGYGGRSGGRGGGGGGGCGYGGRGGGRGGGGGGGRGGFGGKDRGRGKQRAFHEGYDKDAHLMTLVQKFEKFQKFLRGDTARVNAIQSVENACLATGLHLRCEYFSEELPRIYNRQLFTGTLKISGIFLARGVSTNKKELKHDIFKKSLDVLMSKSVDDINDLTDPGVDLVMASVEKYLKERGRGTYQEGVGIPVYQAMSNIAVEVTKHLESVHRIQMGVHKVRNYLQNAEGLPESPISKMEQAFVKAQSNMTHQYIHEAVDPAEDGKLVFEGSFIIDDTCIARASSNSKKQCKIDVYEMALEAILNKPIEDLVIPVEKDKKDEEEEEDINNEAIVAGVVPSSGEGPPPIMKASMAVANLPEKFKQLRTSVINTPFLEFNNHIFDNCMMYNGVKGLTIYRRSCPISTECIACELYVENYLIATGYGSSRAECECDAYNTAYQVITSSTPQEIMDNHKKLLPSQTSGPTVLECVVKQGMSHQTNIPGLRRLGYSSPDQTRAYNSMVIIEEADWHSDRRDRSFCILQHSATMNGMFLEWKFSQEKLAKQQKVYYKNLSKTTPKLICEIFINGTKVSEFAGYGRAKTRNIAASDILYRLYETCSVLRGVDQNVEELWVPFVKLTADATSLKQGGQKIPFDPAQPQLDQYLVKAATSRIDAFFANPNTDELLFGPGIQDLEKIAIRKYALSKNLLYKQRMKSGEVYDVISEKIDFSKVVQILQSGVKKSCGRYKLVPKSECPTHAELKGPKSKMGQ